MPVGVAGGLAMGRPPGAINLSAAKRAVIRLTGTAQILIKGMPHSPVLAAPRSPPREPIPTRPACPIVAAMPVVAFLAVPVETGPPAPAPPLTPPASSVGLVAHNGSTSPDIHKPANNTHNTSHHRKRADPPRTTSLPLNETTPMPATLQQHREYSRPNLPPETRTSQGDEVPASSITSGLCPFCRTAVDETSIHYLENSITSGLCPFCRGGGYGRGLRG